jgi:hypothetical protein
MVVNSANGRTSSRLSAPQRVQGWLTISISVRLCRIDETLELEDTVPGVMGRRRLAQADAHPAATVRSAARTAGSGSANSHRSLAQAADPAGGTTADPAAAAAGGVADPATEAVDPSRVLRPKGAAPHRQAPAHLFYGTPSVRSLPYTHHWLHLQTVSSAVPDSAVMAHWYGPCSPI